MHVVVKGPGEDGLDSLFEAIDLIGLRAFAAFDDVEFNFIALFKAFIAFALNGAVVNEDIRSTIAAEEAITFCVIEPFDGAFILSHLNQLPFLDRARCRDLPVSDAGVGRGVFRVFFSSFPEFFQGEVEGFVQ